MFLALLITGGYRWNVLSSAEIYLPSANTSCSLPELPEGGRYYHTQDGPWACGSQYYDDYYTCDKWSQGSWTRQSLQLRKSRKAHVSWFTASGLYLIGGDDPSSTRTSELVKEDGSVEKAFRLKYATRQDKEDIRSN